MMLKPRSAASGRFRASSLSLSAINRPPDFSSSPAEPSNGVLSAPPHSWVAIREADPELRPGPVGRNGAERLGGRHSNPPVAMLQGDRQFRYAIGGSKPAKRPAAGLTRS